MYIHLDSGFVFFFFLNLYLLNGGSALDAMLIVRDIGLYGVVVDT